MAEAGKTEPLGSILIVGAGVFGLSTAYSLLTNPQYDNTGITILDQWKPDTESERRLSVTPASIDNSRIIRPDYASKPYARLASLAQLEWRRGWPHTLPTRSLRGSQLPINPAADSIRTTHPYRESGLLLTRTIEGEGLNPKAQYYLDGSLENILEMSKYDPSFRGKVEQLSKPQEVAKALGTGACHADRGYINRASGWADAGAAMALLKARTKELVGVRHLEGKAKAVFIDGSEATVQSLTFGSSSTLAHIVTGARLTSGKEFRADLTVLAAGAWSTKLLPQSLNGRVKATGQALGYIAINAAQAAKFAHIPVPLDLSRGLFIFPPIPMEDGSGRLIVKIARHGWGYAYSEAVSNTEPHDSDAPREIQASFPAPDSGHKIASEATNVLLDYVRRLGVMNAEKLHFTRTCWYADTATGDWIMDYAPRYGKSLFVMTGGSGHGFKFAPVLGNWTVKAIEGQLVKAGELGQLLRESWRWRTEEEDREAWLDEGDGSRGGPKGLIWIDEIRKGEDGGVGIPALAREDS